ncbi:FAD-dependent monooxygenase [Frankia sp. AgB32]|uniref:FAD-dependent monooxygenase n=1 Tax=Frankia sp. AgB32 TaxID=631119 RepID=UPI00200DC776|nr:FAD-dependent monooxygenase [Frankia sp. AgB32]MCK9897085.1 FAD-dependent monooxygenase [Frankia sp. AgB32]
MSARTKREVVIIGAGPGGLHLATELGLAGVRVTVLERRARPATMSRAVGLHARSLELLAMRGMADEFLARANPVGHFRMTIGATRIQFRRLPTRFPNVYICPQHVTEELLENRARELGVDIRRGVEVLGVHQDGDGATVRWRPTGPDVPRPGAPRREAEDSAGAASLGGGPAEQWLRADYVVGCDGPTSVVRASAGIDFVTDVYPYKVLFADLRLRHPPADGALIQVGRAGLGVAIDFGDGRWRVGAMTREEQRPASEPATLTEIGAALRRIFGRDLGAFDPQWVSRARFRKGGASTYRNGRVLILGDAAHVQSPIGAQGLNLALHDAANLGWKLAAVVRGGVSPDLLDTFEQERRPWVTRVLHVTDRVFRLAMSPLPPVRAARRVVVPALTSIPAVNAEIAGNLTGLAVRYPPRGGGHAAVVGGRLPDVTIRSADGATVSLFELLREGRFVLVDQGDGALASGCGPWSDRLVTVRGRIVDSPGLDGYRGLLSRPDGYCAWAGDHLPPLREQLHRWCGVARLPRSVPAAATVPMSAPAPVAESVP